MLTGTTLATFAVGASIKMMFAACWTFLHLRRTHSYTGSCSSSSKKIFEPTVVIQHLTYTILPLNDLVTQHLTHVVTSLYNSL